MVTFNADYSFTGSGANDKTVYIWGSILFSFQNLKNQLSPKERAMTIWAFPNLNLKLDRLRFHAHNIFNDSFHS